MSMKKVLAGAMASVMAVSTMAVCANADPVDNGLFHIVYTDKNNDGYWGNEWSTIDAKYLVSPKLEGNGTYVASVDLTDSGKKGNGIDGYLAVTIFWDEYENYKNLGVDIKSVKIDGTAVELNGTSFTYDNEDGRKTVICANWDQPFDSSDNAVSKDSSKATAALVDYSKIGEWTKIEVEFEVYGLDYDKPAADNGDDKKDETSDNTADATQDPAPDSGNDNKPGADTGIEGVAVVAGLAVLATGAIVIAKKRK